MPPALAAKFIPPRVRADPFAARRSQALRASASSFAPMGQGEGALVSDPFILGERRMPGIPLPNQPFPEPTPADPNPAPGRPLQPGEAPLPEPIGVPSPAPEGVP